MRSGVYSNLLPSSKEVLFLMDYVVQSGDTLFFISQKFGISLNTVIAFNPQIQNPDLIYPGQIIIVPVAGKNHNHQGTPGQKSLNLVSVKLEDGREVSASAQISANPKFVLEFDKNVVNESIWENNKRNFSLSSQNNGTVPLSVTRIDDTVDFTQRKKIFIQPLSPLVPGATYNLKISPGLKSKAGMTLGSTASGQGITITFTVIGQALG
jgi:spore coat assembly protein SafA